jgi:hypothetical protein
MTSGSRSRVSARQDHPVLQAWPALCFRRPRMDLTPLPRARLLRTYGRSGAFAVFTLVVLAACSGADPSNLFACTCPATDDPVCGADGITYENACNAQCAGSAVAQSGHCGQDGGTCDCPATSDPVCGTNGVTYENACSATCAHQTIARAGTCHVALPDAGPDAKPTDGGGGVGDCAHHPCGSGQVCVDDGCTVSVCEQLEPTATSCSPGWIFASNTSCYPGGAPPPPDGPPGVCVRSCPDGAVAHHCVNLPPSCTSASCACLPGNVCPSSSCAGVSNGIVSCAPLATAGGGAAH